MLKKIIIAVMFFCFCFTIIGTGVYAVNTNDTRLLSNPALSKDHIAFIYANNLWVAELDGKNPRQLTTDSSIIESSPFFSPDGKTIAFTAFRNGNSDVYIIPSEGGISKRLTWHPDDDIVCGFTHDGKSVLFTSGGYSSNVHYTRMFSVPLQGGFPTGIPIPNINKGVYSPDGNNIAYNPLPEAFGEWKGYRGGQVSEIWIYNLSKRTFYKIKQPKGRCNDVDPLWMENKIYFLSDRNGEFNIFSFDTENNDIKQLTFHDDFPVLNISACNGNIIYEQAGYLHIYNLDTGKNEKLFIGLSPELPELREHYVTPNIYNYDISPSGARVVFEARGEIVTMPAKKGDPRNITGTPGINERSPVWSPDGKSIAYFSDESGEYELHIKNQDGKGEAKKYKLPGGGFYENPLWSPDGKKISYMDNNQNLYWINLEDGIVKKIASERMVIDKTVTSNIDYFNNTWSPDSKWIVYTMYTKTYISKIYLYSVENDKSYPVTDGMSDATSPIFDDSGKYLYFLASLDAGPVNQVTDLSSVDFKLTRSIYVVTLSKDLPSPLAKESDEEKGIQKEEKDKDKKETPKTVTIDFDGIKYRILSLPLTRDSYSKLYPGKAEQFYYLKEDPSTAGRKRYTIFKYDLKERKEKNICSDVYKYKVSGNKEKILYKSSSSWCIIPASGSNSLMENIDIGNISIKVVPELEWKQIFHEAWRINRDYFYDPNMHGVNWKSMEEKYSIFLPDVPTRQDLNRVIGWMNSELRVGHHWVGGGDMNFYYSSSKTGLLGADYVIENGRYKIKKIYEGINWNSLLRSPLRGPGVNVSEGEYILMVNGKELTSDVDIYSLFDYTAEKITEITVSKDPSGKNSRNISVVPVYFYNERFLRYMDWIEGNIARVDKATGGRVAYVYVPDTSKTGYMYFRRYFFPQGDKDAIIIDERFNGGGFYADYYIDLLRRENVCYFTTRYGDDLRVPASMIDGPKVMLVNEQAGSGGDLLPWTFRKFNMGKIIGKRTWGGLVGLWGFPDLMDGGYITAPNSGTWSDGEWIVENEGVAPDIEVEQNPADVMDGHDPQLEKAIDFVMKELLKKSPEKIVRPPYPDKVNGEK